MRSFNIEEAKSGKTVCLRNGMSARIICFDRDNYTPIVVLVRSRYGKEDIYTYANNGRILTWEGEREHPLDLMMAD